MRSACRSMLLLTLCLAACGCGKQSAIEGRLVDAKGVPLAAVKVAAVQVQPLKGYEQFEAVTKADGAFRLSGLFPSSAYVLKISSDKWITSSAVHVQTAPWIW